MRIIHSTVAALDLDDDQAEAHEEAISRALESRNEARQSYDLDELGQKAYQIALVPYTAPTGEHRWAVLDSGPTEAHWEDTSDLDEAITAYEKAVRNTSSGNEQPSWDYSDVTGVSARKQGDPSDGNTLAYMRDAEAAHKDFTAAEAAYQQAVERRQIAFARVVDPSKRGSQAALAIRVNLKDPTVKSIAERGRALLLAEQSAEESR